MSLKAIPQNIVASGIAKWGGQNEKDTNDGAFRGKVITETAGRQRQKFKSILDGHGRRSDRKYCTVVKAADKNTSTMKSAPANHEAWVDSNNPWAREGSHREAAATLEEPVSSVLSKARDAEVSQIEPIAMTPGPWDLARKAAGTPTISIFLTDLPADCDDQKAISQHIAGLREGDRSFFIVGGPDPENAARAIAEAYFAKTKEYPAIAVATQHKSGGQVYSLVDGSPMKPRKVKEFRTVTLKTLMFQIDEAIKGGTFGQLQQCVFGPMQEFDEYYDPSGRFASNPTLEKNWDALAKTAAVQFERAPNRDGAGYKYGGFNYNQSKKESVTHAFNKMLLNQGYATTYFEGAAAKVDDFLLSAQQKQPGIDNAISTYMIDKQISWANMPGAVRTTPGPEDMHVTMFADYGEFSFKMHASVRRFGIERLVDEVCGVAVFVKDEADKDTEIYTEEFRELAAAINAEMDGFDAEVLQELRKQHPRFTDVAAMRAEMHDAMTAALKTFAQTLGLGDTSPTDFASLFEKAEERNIKIDMDKFRPLLLKENAVVKSITDIAQRLTVEAKSDKGSYLHRIVSILTGSGARAVVYDAVALAAAHAVATDADLTQYFKAEDGACYVSRDKVKGLKISNPDLYERFRNGVRGELAQDDCQLAVAA